MTPGYATAVGLLQWGAISLSRRRTAALRVGAGRWRHRADPRRPAEHLPVETRGAHGPDRLGPRPRRPDGGLCGVPRRLEAEDGLLSLFVPHATAGLVIVEIGAGSDDDLLDALDRVLPREDRLYRHRHGSPGHGADHVLPLLAPPSLTVPVLDGRMALGTWQSICLLDPNADNATRTVRLSFLAG